MPLEIFKGMKKGSFDRTNAIIGAVVFLIAFTVYYLTKAATFSYWDCGEFIAAAYNLGVPHPPGTPLMILLGRLFSMLPTAGDISVRVNLLSCFSSGLSAMFGYLIIVRLIRHWYEDSGDAYRRAIIYIGGFTGALFMAFANTNWFNSVEAEIYALTILYMMFIYWLVLKYFDNRGTDKATRIMLIIPFLALLGVGLSLMIYTFIPLLALYFILDRKAGPKEWAIVSFFFFVELYLIFQLSSRLGEVPFYLPTILLFIAFLFHSTMLPKVGRATLVSVGLFLIAIFPIYPIIIGAFSRHILGNNIDQSLEGVKNLPIGWIGLVMLTIWGLICLFKYISSRGSSDDPNKWLIPAIYSIVPIALIGIGRVFTGYTAFLALTVICLAAVALAVWRHINWLVLIGIVSISMVILGVWQLVWGLVIGSFVIIILGFILKDTTWKTAILITLLAAIGYSVHGFIPIRSARHPWMNENNPSQSTAALVGYLERKQYGSESMTERMFVRRGEWTNQFGDYQRMGFWHFFRDQYGFHGPRFFFVLILGLFGIWEMIRRKPEIGLPFLVLLLITSVGLVLYMNFADGTRIDKITGEDYLEVRDRDYFFTPAYVLFGLAIGLGIAAVMDVLRDLVKRYKRTVQKTVFGVSCLMIFLPLVPLTANYFVNDRSKNYMPYDYANNLMMTCDQGAILFTGGDNDTFPLWCIQDVYGVRPDVKVVNFSLSNLAWYIKQLRDQRGVPITLSDAEIDALRPYYFKETKEIVRIQDQILEHIVATNKGKLPIYLTVSSPEVSHLFQGEALQDHLVLEGMLYRLTPGSKKNQIDFEKVKELYTQKYIYRGVGDPNVYKDENESRLAANYAQGFLVLADSLRRAGNLPGAFEYIKQGLKVVPQSFELSGYGVSLLGMMGKGNEVRAFIESAGTNQKEKLYYNWAMTARQDGKIAEALRILEMTYSNYPDYSEGYRGLAAMYYQNQYYGKLRQLVAEWVKRHPEDAQSRQILSDMQKVNVAADTTEGKR